VRARIFLGIVFLPIAFTASAQEVLREHRNVNVSAGREGRLGYYASPDEACETGAAPEIAIVEPPNYGRIAFRPDRVMAYSSTIRGNVKGCSGKFVDTTGVYYKSSAGYHGSDRVVLRVRFPAANGEASTLFDTIYISVY
jgi:hypothetical protein